MPLSASRTSTTADDVALPIEDERPPTVARRLKDLLLGPKAANLAVSLAIVIGFFHGWLKLKIRHPIATFFFDIPLIIALFITWRRVGSIRDWFPRARSTTALLAFYVVVAIWFGLSQVLPWGAPILAACAAVRAWVFATLMFGLGYHIIVSRRQLHGYFILIILLSSVTALYATRQTMEEVDAIRAMDPYFAMMTRGQSFVDDEGTLVLRRFSTFVSSGAFGGTMAVSLLFLAALFTDGKIAKKEKALLLILALIIGWGMSLSGARSAVAAVVVGLGIIIWFRRLPMAILMLGGTLGSALFLAARSTGGGIMDRLAQLNFETIWGRFYIVWEPGIRYLLQSSFIGGGLGKGGVGYSVSLASYFGNFQMWAVDGDMGKTMVELGIVGVVVVAWLLAAAILDGLEILRRRRRDSVGTLALGAVCAFSIAVMTFPIGSPFIGIPLGVLTWFFLGAAIKLDLIEDHDDGSGLQLAVSVPNSAGGQPRHGSRASASRSSTPSQTPTVVQRDFLFRTMQRRPKGTPRLIPSSSKMRTNAAAAAEGRSSKDRPRERRRFLFR